MSDDLIRLNNALNLAALRQSLSNEGGAGVAAISDRENGQSSPKFEANNSAKPKLKSCSSVRSANPFNQIRTKARAILKLDKNSCQAQVETPDQIALRIVSSKPLPAFYILPIGNQPMLDEERYNWLLTLYTRHYHHSLAFELLNQIKPNSPESLKLKSSRDEILEKIKRARR